MPKCPVCGEELMEVGYPDELGFQKYKCPNGCKFETPLSWKIWNAVGVAIFLALLLIGLVISAIVTVARRAFRGV